MKKIKTPKIEIDKLINNLADKYFTWGSNKTEAHFKEDLRKLIEECKKI